MNSFITAGKPRRRMNISVGRNARFHFRNIIVTTGGSEFGSGVVPEAGDSLISDTGLNIITDTGDQIIISGP
jgi:hypothetical protein